MISVDILIVEDETIIAQDIAFCVQDMGHKVAGRVTSAEAALDLIKSNEPDLVLLDINLGGEMDGIDLGRLLDQQFRIPFIYLTSYYDGQTINRAKETYPAAYIIKPFAEQDLKLNIELAIHRQRLPRQEVKSSKFFVKRGQDLIAIEAVNITYAEAYDNYAKIHTPEETFLVSHTLKTIEEKLTEHGFLRIHKSYLINFEKISAISEGMVYIGDKPLPIGKSYKQQLQNRLLTL